MAFVAPVIITIIFGILQFGYAFMVQHALQDAARQGCRAAIPRNRTNSAVTSCGRPIATTRISASRQTSGRSRVRE